MSDLSLDSIATPSITDAYVSERVLDPSVLDKTLVERMPEPTGWRLLVLPYKGKGVTDGGIQLLESTVSKENLATSVCYVLKVGPWPILITISLAARHGAKRAIGFSLAVMLALDSL